MSSTRHSSPLGGDVQGPFERQHAQGPGVIGLLTNKPAEHQPKAVDWLAPKELTRTALQVVLSKAFGDYLDKRDLQPVLTAEAPRHIKRQETWIDYVADVADGYRASLAVATALESPQPMHASAGPNEATLAQPGSVLVFGGDEVYPLATREGYQRRLVNPYRAAAQPGHERTVYALPGNHDWYDGLTAFFDMFCVKRAFFDESGPTWALPQERSYSAFPVGSHPWHMIGIDFSLADFIDRSQRTYLADYISKCVPPGDGLIVCLAEPIWEKSTKSAKQRQVVQELLADAKIGGLLFLAGDKHYLATFASTAGAARPVVCVTAGGGGAYLSATTTVGHHTPVSPVDDTDELDITEIWPTKRRSKWLVLGGLLRCHGTPERSRW